MQIHFKKATRYIIHDLKKYLKGFDKKKIRTECQEVFLKKQFLKHIFWESNFKAASLFQKSDFKWKMWNIISYKDYKKN